MGHSRKIGRAAKMGWEKIWLPAMIAALAPRIRFYLHKEFRAAGIRFLSTQTFSGPFWLEIVEKKKRKKKRKKKEEKKKKKKRKKKK